jgi:hypothetical protein
VLPSTSPEARVRVVDPVSEIPEGTARRAQRTDDPGLLLRADPGEHRRTQSGLDQWPVRAASAAAADGGSLAGGPVFAGLQESAVDYALNSYNKDLLGTIPKTLDQLKQKIANGDIQILDKPTG